MLPASGSILRSAKVPGKARRACHWRFDAPEARLSPQRWLFGDETRNLLRQIAVLLRHFNERNSPVNLLHSSAHICARRFPAAAARRASVYRKQAILSS